VTGRAAARLSALTLNACTAVTTSTDLSAAGSTCTKAVDKAISGMGDQYAGRDFVEVGKGGASLSVSSPVSGENGAIVSATAVGCILRETEAPGSVQIELEGITAQDGRQEASWNDVTMSYLFDPDRGLRVVLTAD